MFERFKAEKRLRALEEAFEEHQRHFKNLKLEWEDTYDKLIGLYQRIAKRAQRVERAAAGAGAEAGDLGTPVADGLTERARSANEEILARRRRGIPNSVNREQ